MADKAQDRGALVKGDCLCPQQLQTRRFPERSGGMEDGHNCQEQTHFVVDLNLTAARFEFALLGNGSRARFSLLDRSTYRSQFEPFGILNQTGGIADMKVV